MHSPITGSTYSVLLIISTAIQALNCIRVTTLVSSLSSHATSALPPLSDYDTELNKKLATANVEERYSMLISHIARKISKSGASAHNVSTLHSLVAEMNDEKFPITMDIATSYINAVGRTRRWHEVQQAHNHIMRTGTTTYD